MSRDALALILALSMFGGVAGGAAVLGMRGVVRWIARRRGIPVPPRHGDDRHGNGNGEALRQVHGSITELRGSVGELIREVRHLSRALGPAPAGGSPHAEPQGRPPISRREWTHAGSSAIPGVREDSEREPTVRRRDADEWSSAPGGASRAPAERDRPPRPSRDPWETPGRADWLERIESGGADRAGIGNTDSVDADASSHLAHGGFGPPAPARSDAPVAPRAPAGPPPNAVNVEARDDRIVASSSYPPEAWLEPRGPAVAHLWLNPSVALNENALRRLSTFFEWRGAHAGATYDTETPAVLNWDEGQRVGTVKQRGTARPR